MMSVKFYTMLEDKMLTYRDLVDVPVIPNGEPLEAISDTKNKLVNPIDPNMAAFTGKDIYVRRSVAAMLNTTSLAIARANPQLKLQIVYGYRALSIQTSLYEGIKANLSKQFEGIELMEAVHRMVAVPEIAGHPTGGAVDVQLTRDGEPLDFGTEIWEFAPDSYTFSPFISRESWSNRQLLRRCMMEAGFAPFDGEWWHFSYGDKEWAKFYSKSNAIYDQVEFSHAK